MPPPALSRLVPELYHVSVDYFVARPGLVLLPVLPLAFSGHFCWSVAKKVDQKAYTRKTIQGSRCSSSLTCTRIICRGFKTDGVRCVPAYVLIHDSLQTCALALISFPRALKARCAPLTLCPLEFSKRLVFSAHRQGTLFCSQLSRSVCDIAVMLQDWCSRLEISSQLVTLAPHSVLFSSLQADAACALSNQFRKVCLRPLPVFGFMKAVPVATWASISFHQTSADSLEPFIRDPISS